MDFQKLNTRVWIWERDKSSIFKKLDKHWLGLPHLKRECGASLNVTWARMSNSNTVQMDSFPQVKYMYVDLGEG